MIEDDDMRAVFFDPEDFGVIATFKPNVGDPFTAAVMFDRRPVADRALDGAQVAYDRGAKVTGNTPEARCRTSDIADKVKAGRCVVEIDGVDYNVFDVKPDFTGLSALCLKVA